MKTFPLVLVAVLVLNVWPVMAETYEGPGPDPACQGTALTIVKEEGKVVKISYAIIGSASTVLEEYAVRPKGDWDVVVSIFKTATDDGTPIKEKLTGKYKFISTDGSAAEAELAKVGLEDVKWSKEPARLIKYFEKNRKEFELSPAKQS